MEYMIPNLGQYGYVEPNESSNWKFLPYLIISLIAGFFIYHFFIKKKDKKKDEEEFPILT